MNIIVTKTFEKEFYKIFNKKIELSSFCNKIKIWKFINLKIPYQKYKFSISWISIRWIIVIHNDKINIIPIFVIKKSDKTYWDNLILNKEIDNILNLKYDKAISDIRDNNYTSY